MTPEYTGFWRVLFDWQTIIAGLLALAAGLLAFFAAQRQVRAIKDQTRHFQREAKKHQAREAIIAGRLLDGVLSTLEDGIRSLQKTLAQPTYKLPNATIPASYKETLRKPPLATVWDRLGMFDPNAITNYMNLDAKVDLFRTDQIFAAAWNIEALAPLAVIVSTLRRMIGEESKLAHDVILATESS